MTHEELNTLVFERFPDSAWLSVDDDAPGGQESFTVEVFWSNSKRPRVIIVDPKTKQITGEQGEG